MLDNNDLEDFNLYKKKTSLWVKLVLLLLLLTGGLIGWATNEGYIKEEPLQESILQAFNSSIIVRDYSLGVIMYDLTENEPSKVKEQVNAIIQCESNGDHTKIGDKDYKVNGIKTQSFGIGQFQFRTFEWLKGLANKPTLDYTLEKDQIWLLEWAIVNGYGYLWSCSHILGYD